MKPTAIVKTDQCLLKVYDHGSDWQILASEPVKHKELWFSNHSDGEQIDSLQYAIHKAIAYNGLTGSERVY